MEINSENLIESIWHNPCLYDKTCEGYKDFKKKDKIWNEFGERLGSTGRDCKARWRNLRDNYRREKTSQKAPSGSAAKPISNWKYYNAMKFLNDSLEPASTTGNVDDDIWLTEVPSPVRKPKRKNEEVITEILTCMKGKYAKPKTEKYEPFFAMVRLKFEKLTEDKIEDVQLEILQILTNKIRK